MKIVICSSVSFVEEYTDVARQLEALGHTVEMPGQPLELSLEKGGGRSSVHGFFEASGGVKNFPPGHEIWQHKRQAMLVHFQKIAGAHAILVTNYSKNGVDNYIGANTLIEMGQALAGRQSIYGAQPVA